ncbi:MAG: type II toxin-antitoxin system VapC family toxin, partial [Ignavibacteria bacterium]|nr:type II toxin-antitoxin system VapC family toxin [Ignavibacteria bacterium]
MADKIVLADTSILIDYYRKTDKENSLWVNLVRQGYSFAVSSITKYEIYTGATATQLTFWNNIFQAITLMPLDETSVDTAVSINNSLKKKRKQIDLADLFIAATAVANNLPL